MFSVYRIEIRKIYQKFISHLRKFFTFYFKDGFTYWILESRYKESTIVNQNFIYIVE